ncbi:MAG: hypothetical protein ACLVL7_00220 [Anaerotruncus massiliensis (ex Togo et al. 2019)]
MRRIAALCAILVLLAGCVPSVRLNERGVVQAIGIDLAEEGGYRPTIQVSEAVGAAPGANQAPEDAKTVLVEETGATMTELLARASATRAAALLGSVRVIVFGQEAARAGAEGRSGSSTQSPDISGDPRRGGGGEAGAHPRGRKDPALSAEAGGRSKARARAAFAAQPPQDLMGAANAENAAGAVTLLRYSAPIRRKRVAVFGGVV